MKVFRHGAVLITLVALLLGCNDSPRRSIDFRAKDYPANIVARVSGISGAESWGRWTDGSKAVVEFKEALPNKFQLELQVASVFADNVNAPVKAIAGNVQREFKITAANQRIVVDFDGVNNAKAIAFEIPKPASPKDLGKGNDARKLGIGLVSLTVK